MLDSFGNFKTWFSVLTYVIERKNITKNEVYQLDEDDLKEVFSSVSFPLEVNTEIIEDDNTLIERLDDYLERVYI